MVCSKCYKEIEETSEFCQYCGNKVEKEVNKRKPRFEEEEEGWVSSFESFTHIPAIITVINALIVFICSMVCCSSGVDDDRMMATGLVVMIVGAIVCLCLYYLIKIAIAPIVVQTKCLLRLVKKSEEENKTETTKNN